MNAASSHNSDLESQSSGSVTQAQLEFWHALAQLAREEELAELEVEQDGVRVRLSAQVAPSQVVSAAPSTLPATPVTFAPAVSSHGDAQPPSTSTPARDESVAQIVSPMVGVFYRAPSPADPNFVEVGDKIEAGQTVALIEAMKVFNEITAEVSGTVIEIKSQNSDLVETGQTLMTVRAA